MEINRARLERSLAGYDCIMIYGTGNIAKEVYHILIECGRKPACCIVTNKNDCNEFFQGIIPVYELDEQVRNIKKGNVCVLVAVSELYEKEIERALQDYGIFNYFLILDFDMLNIRHLEHYKEMNIQECMEELTQWRAEDMGFSGEEAEMEKQRIQRAVDNNHKNNMRIIFVIGEFTQRSLKIAGALQDKGYEIKMFVEPGGRILESCQTGLSELQITYIRCKTVEELMYRVVMEQGGIVHLFTEGGNAQIDRILIQMKEMFPPVVYDEYDIISEMYKQTLIAQSVFDNERFCLEYAEAICNRGYEIDYLKHVCNYHINARVLQFHDYCCDVQCEFENTNDFDSVLNLCYVGGLPTKEEYFDSYVKCFFELAEQCRQNQCHLYIYPSVWDENKWDLYIELERQNDFFHIHKPVSFERLKFEISRYDYGVFPIKDMELQTGVGIYTREKMVYSTTNKYFDYLDAGLPVIAAYPIKLVRFLEKKGVLINWTVEEYDFDELRRRKKEMKRQILIERESFRISNHIEDLIDFYHTLK